MLRAEAKLGDVEDPIDDVEAVLHAIVDELGIAFPVYQKNRRRLADGQRCREPASLPRS